MNPTTLYWTGPSKNVDGSEFDEAQYGGFELEVDDTPAIALPHGWSTDYQYQMELADLDMLSGPAAIGEHRVRMRTVNKAGLVSDWTPYVTFTIAAAPMPPLAVRVQ